MPLDRLQHEILTVLARLRTEDSVLAGGSVLHRHAFRLSDDSDIFHSDRIDIATIANADVEALRAAGLDVDLALKHEGLYEATVYAEGQHPAKLQWVQSGLMNFFGSVEDDVFGRRLHMADLSVNKVLAAAGRKEVRDFVDLAMIHEHLMPLWHALWAAPGKDSEWNPRSIKERIARHCAFTQAELDSEVDSLLPLRADTILSTVRAALDDAEAAFARLPHGLAGNVFIDEDENLVNDIQAVIEGLDRDSVRAVGPVTGGTLPSGPDIDRAMIQNLVDTYGWEGSEIPDY